MGASYQYNFVGAVRMIVVEPAGLFVEGLAPEAYRVCSQKSNTTDSLITVPDERQFLRIIWWCYV